MVVTGESLLTQQRQWQRSRRLSAAWSKTITPSSIVHPQAEITCRGAWTAHIGHTVCSTHYGVPLARPTVHPQHGQNTHPSPSVITCLLLLPCLLCRHLHPYQQRSTQALRTDDRLPTLLYSRRAPAQRQGVQQGDDGHAAAAGSAPALRCHRRGGPGLQPQLLATARAGGLGQTCHAPACSGGSGHRCHDHLRPYETLLPFVYVGGDWIYGSLCCCKLTRRLVHTVVSVCADAPALSSVPVLYITSSLA